MLLRSHRTRQAAVLAALPLLVAGFLAGASNAGCSRDGEPGEAEPDAGAAISPVIPPPAKVPPPRIPDAGIPDARAVQELLAIADAGRFCGSKDLPDCPLQLWMKQNATTMLELGEITTLAEVFDKIAQLAPPGPGYPYWVSISHDGAAATRTGNLEAAKAACRGCHTQYLASYRASFRGLPLPPNLRGTPP